MSYTLVERGVPLAQVCATCSATRESSRPSATGDVKQEPKAIRPEPPEVSLAYVEREVLNRGDVSTGDPCTPGSRAPERSRLCASRWDSPITGANECGWYTGTGLRERLERDICGDRCMTLAGSAKKTAALTGGRPCGANESPAEALASVAGVERTTSPTPSSRATSPTRTPRRSG